MMVMPRPFPGSTACPRGLTEVGASATTGILCRQNVPRIVLLPYWIFEMTHYKLSPTYKHTLPENLNAILRAEIPFSFGRFVTATHI